MWQRVVPLNVEKRGPQPYKTLFNLYFFLVRTTYFALILCCLHRTFNPIPNLLFYLYIIGSCAITTSPQSPHCLTQLSYTNKHISVLIFLNFNNFQPCGGVIILTLVREVKWLYLDWWRKCKSSIIGLRWILHKSMRDMNAYDHNGFHMPIVSSICKNQSWAMHMHVCVCVCERRRRNMD